MSKPFVSPQQFAQQQAKKPRYTGGNIESGKVTSAAQMNSARDKAGASGVGFGGEPPAKKIAKTAMTKVAPPKNKMVKTMQVKKTLKPSMGKTSRY